MIERNWREWGQGDHPPMTPQEALDALVADSEEWDRYEAPTWWERFKAWLAGSQ